MLKIELENKELPYEIEEELKTLRTNIQLSGDDKKVILFTSCLGGEGKSNTSLNIARSMAALGKNVLLIDADLRKSVLADRVVSGRVKYGLTHYLVGKCQAKDVLYQTEQAGVYVIPAGEVPPNPSELLSNERMSQLLAVARERYDYIFVDCPPLGMVVDAAVFASHCDGSILVLASGEISYRFAQEVVKKLRATKCPILGVALNKVDHAKGKYYGSKYHKYYKSHYENA